jgi:hypothetical protein
MATLPRTQLYVQASGSAVQHHTIAVIPVTTAQLLTKTGILLPLI